jgi:ssDNA-binding Zn-finger/Zn-ribbon topoisomerase 1
MSLPDSAEYWWDVKGHNRSWQPRYLHLTGKPCGKTTGGETDNLDDVSCRHCKKTEQFKKLLALDTPPKCTCGYTMTKRVNSVTKQSFWGCRNYPKCKNTKPLTPTPSSPKKVEP